MSKRLRRTGIAVIIILLAVLLYSPDPPFSLSIVAPNKSPERPIIITLHPKRTFLNVRLRNVSLIPHRIWNERMSWGYFCLQFTMTDAAGESIRVFKAGRAWLSNFPDPVTLWPGQYKTFEVSFDPDVWINSPFTNKVSVARTRLQAVFEIPVDEETEEYHVWTGRVLSPEDEYELHYGPAEKKKAQQGP